MSRETQIKVITYEEERLNYFTDLMKKSIERYKRLYEKFKDAPMLSAEYQALSDAGREAQFHGDIVEMLENGYHKQEWISVDERRPQEFVSVLGYMTDAEDFPSVRECYMVGRVFFFPALKDAHPVSHWMPLPQAPKGERQ